MSELKRIKFIDETPQYDTPLLVWRDGSDEIETRYINGGPNGVTGALYPGGSSIGFFSHWMYASELTDYMETTET